MGINDDNIWQPACITENVYTWENALLTPPHKNTGKLVLKIHIAPTHWHNFSYLTISKVQQSSESL